MSVDLAEHKTTNHIFYLDDIPLKEAYKYLFNIKNKHLHFVFIFRLTKREHIRVIHRA